MRFLHDHLGGGIDNWGWAIIIFTALFNIIMMPTRFWAMKSSLKMMRIQPKVEAIKARYKNFKATDPKRADMNTEMMELYKTEGVNMYGSCLPMLPQIPLFFAYFRVLLNAVELRQAHWFWLTDLSSPDPKYILPILIIVSMFLMQYITPSPGMDPTQRRMMAFMMPVCSASFCCTTPPGWPSTGAPATSSTWRCNWASINPAWARRCTPSPPSGLQEGRPCPQDRPEARR